jgi:hypothetical protein
MKKTTTATRMATIRKTRRTISAMAQPGTLEPSSPAVLESVEAEAAAVVEAVMVEARKVELVLVELSALLLLLELVKAGPFTIEVLVLLLLLLLVASVVVKLKVVVAVALEALVLVFTACVEELDVMAAVAAEVLEVLLAARVDEVDVEVAVAAEVLEEVEEEEEPGGIPPVAVTVESVVGGGMVDSKATRAYMANVNRRPLLERAKNTSPGWPGSGGVPSASALPTYKNTGAQSPVPPQLLVPATFTSTAGPFGGEGAPNSARKYARPGVIGMGVLGVNSCVLNVNAVGGGGNEERLACPISGPGRPSTVASYRSMRYEPARSEVVLSW